MRDTVMKQLGDMPKELNLTQESHLASVTQAADRLLGETGLDLDDLERTLVQQRDAWPLGAHLAVKLARSRRALESLTKPTHLSVVFAVYKEHERILSRNEHPYGENFLKRKVEQLRWLFQNRPDSDWSLYVVDDGCPNESGVVAEKQRERLGLENVRVLFLKDAIEAGLAVTRPMTSTADSQKGGAIQYAMSVAAEENRNGIVIFTDADLSTHLGQCGLLVDAIQRGGALAAIGSRRERASVVVKKGTRNTRGKLFIYLWKRMLHALPHLIDTQCGFKAFRADIVSDLVSDTSEKRFAFDIELLLRTAALGSNASIKKIAIAWIDSETLSTTTEIQPYLPMLKAIAGMYRRYLPENAESDEFAGFVHRLNDVTWQRLANAVPAAIADADPSEFTALNSITTADLENFDGESDAVSGVN